jgi:hypothetical protein
LWDKPEVAIYSQIVNLRWRDERIVAIPQNYRSPFTYRTPLTYVAFEAVD